MCSVVAARELTTASHFYVIYHPSPDTRGGDIRKEDVAWPSSVEVKSRTVSHKSCEVRSAWTPQLVDCSPEKTNALLDAVQWLGLVLGKMDV